MLPVAKNRCGERPADRDNGDGPNVGAFFDNLTTVDRGTIDYRAARHSLRCSTVKHFCHLCHETAVTKTSEY